MTTDDKEIMTCIDTIFPDSIEDLTSDNFVVTGCDRLNFYYVCLGRASPSSALKHALKVTRSELKREEEKAQFTETDPAKVWHFENREKQTYHIWKLHT